MLRKVVHMSKVMKVLTRDWQELVKAIPDDLETSAKEYQALRRRRGIKSGADLLRLILLYAIVLSLRLTAVWGVGLKLCDISRQAIEKRVLNSTPWLRYLVAVLLQTVAPAPATVSNAIKRLLLYDGSTFSRPGSPGTEWRLHLGWQPFALQPAGLTTTDAHTGESLANAGVQAGDLVLADRAYGIWREIQIVLDALAYLVIRLTWSNLPLCTLDGQSFDLPAWLRSIPKSQQMSEVMVFAANDPDRRPLRLVAGRVPPEKAQEARDAAYRRARKKKWSPHPNTLLAAGFCLLLTNLPAHTWPTWSILAWYRVRWQVEWCFRRWKSLCHLDQLPAYPSRIAEPVLLAKIIIVLLMQQRLGALPWADWWANPHEPAPVVSTVVQLAYARVCDLIRPTAVIDQLLQNPTPLLRHLRSSRRKRPLQLTDALQQLRNMFASTPLSPPRLCCCIGR
jgi:hypothetical protein